MQHGNNIGKPVPSAPAQNTAYGDIRSFSRETGGCWRFLPVSALKRNTVCVRNAGCTQNAECVTIRRLIDIVNMNGLLTVLRISSVHGLLSVDVAARFPCGDRPNARMEAVDSVDRWEHDMRYAFGEVFEFGACADRPSVETTVRDGYEIRPSMAGDCQDGRRQDPDDIDLSTEEERVLSALEGDLTCGMNGFTKGTCNILSPFHETPSTMLFDAMRRADTTITYALYKAEPDAISLLDGQDLGFAPNTPPLSLRVCITAPDIVDRGVLSEYKTLSCANFRRLTGRELHSACVPQPQDMRECVLPIGIVSTYLRFPTAGANPVKGMATLPRERFRRPLEQPYEPARVKPIRLGGAIDETGSAIDVTVEPEDLTTHMHVMGAPGSGKTTFLVDLAHELASQGVGFICLSTHRDLMDRVLSDGRVSEQEFHLRGVDHSDGESVVPINPLAEYDDDMFALKVSELTDAIKEYIDPRQQGMFGERGASAFALVALACRKLGCASIPMVTSVVSSQELCKVLAQVIRDTDPSLARRIDQELGGLTGPEASDLFSWMSSRFNVIHSSPLLMRILGTGMNDIDLAKLMDGSDTGVAVNLAGGELGTASAQFLLACWLIQIKSAMRHRRNPDKPFVVIVDEAHAAAFGPLASMLDEARKFGVCVVVAHQRIGQLNQRLADALEADAGSFIALRTGLRDSRRASERLGGWPSDDLMRMPAFEAAATISRAGMTTMPFTLTVDAPRDDERTRSGVLHERQVLSNMDYCRINPGLFTVAGPDTAFSILKSAAHPS